MTKTFRHSASFGKRQEYVAIAELLKRGYDVYMTLVDDQGIDCIVRQGPNENSQWGQSKLTLTPGVETYWVIPSTKLVEPGFSNVLKSGPSEGKYRVMLTNYSAARNVVTPRPKYEAYENAFESVGSE